MKDRDLIDYAHFGLSAAQTYKISQMASELRRLRETADHQETKSRRLGHFRQMALMVEELLSRLESDVNDTETSLQRQFAMAFEAESALTVAGVLPQVEFESWEDKERIGNLEERIDTLKGKLLKAMPDEQRRDAERCVQYMEEEPELKQLILVRSESELERDDRSRLQEVEAQLKVAVKASPETKMIRGIAWLGLYMLGISLAGIFIGGCLEEHHVLNLGEKAGIPLFIMLLVGCAIYLGQFALRAMTADKLVPENITKLEAERKELKAKVGRSEEGSERVSSFERLAALAGDEIIVKSLTEKFGGEESAKKLREMYIERREFVRSIIGPHYLAYQDAEPEDEESETPVR